MLSTVEDRIKESATSAAKSDASENSMIDHDTETSTTSHQNPRQSSAPKASEMTVNPYDSAPFHQPTGRRKNGWFETTLFKQSPGFGFSIWLAIPAIVALSLSGYLAFTSLTSSAVAGCSGEVFDCNSVLHSRWAVWFGIPVSLLAATTYVSLLGALALAQIGSAAQRNLMWMIVTVCSFSAGAAALWFTYLQFFVLEHLCVYCLAAHACGLILAISFLIKNPLGTETSFRLGILAMTGLVIISVGQSIGKEPVTYTIEQFEPRYLNTRPVEPIGGNDSNGDNIGAPTITAPTDATELNDPQIIDAPGDDSIFEAPDIFEAPKIDAPNSGTSDKQTLLQITPERQTSDRYRPASKLISNLRHTWRWPILSLTSIVEVQEPIVPSTVNDQTTDSNSGDSATSDATTTPAEGKDDLNESGSNAKKEDETATQPIQKPKVENVAPESNRRLAPISGGTIKLDVNQWPLVGKPDAKYLFVEMFDYSCPHCRKTHAHAIKGAQEKLAGDLAVLALPLPLNTGCNDAIEQTGALFGESCEIAKLAVAVWRVDPEKFTDFHNWMFAGEIAPNYAAAKRQADLLVDPGKLAAELNSTIPAAFIKKHVEIYKRVGKGNVPKLMFPTTSIVGEFGSADALVELIKKQHPAN